jgi:hypothetical protein
VIGPKVLAVRWLLLCALAFGLVGMHHLATTSHHDGEHTEVTAVAAPAGERLTPTITEAVFADGCCDEHTTGGHDLLHLCLVILAAGLVLAALLARWRRYDPEASPLLRGFPLALRLRLPRASPDPAAILTSLGVLRL